MSSVNKSICIIDDDKVYTFGVKKIIKNHLPENRVTTYDNGKTAIDAIKKMITNNEDLPDLILLDIDMPEMNGWDFLNEFEMLKDRINKTVNIFVISSRIDHGKDDLFRVEWDDKVSDFIKKPVNTAVLKKILESRN